MADTPKKKMGRPPRVMSDEVLRKLEEAFAIGASDGEACFYADIATRTLYDYQSKNPDFLHRKEQLKERPVLMARQTILDNMKDPATAKWFMERKRKSEFATRTDVTTGDEPIQFTVVRGDK